MLWPQVYCCFPYSGLEGPGSAHCNLRRQAGVSTAADEEKHRQRRSDKAASISIKRHKAKLEALEAKGVISVTFHQSRAKRWQTSTSECVKQMAADQPEFAQQFEAAATHLMKLISDADWLQEQRMRQGSAALSVPVSACWPAADVWLMSLGKAREDALVLQYPSGVKALLLCPSVSMSWTEPHLICCLTAAMHERMGIASLAGVQLSVACCSGSYQVYVRLP